MCGGVRGVTTVGAFARVGGGRPGVELVRVRPHDFDAAVAGLVAAALLAVALAAAFHAAALWAVVQLGRGVAGGGRPVAHAKRGGTAGLEVGAPIGHVFEAERAILVEAQLGLGAFLYAHVSNRKSERK